MKSDLVSEKQHWQRGDAHFYYWPRCYSELQADHFFDMLRQQLHWQQDSIKLFGKLRKIPRLQAWYADQGVEYRYSGLTLQRHKWLPVLNQLRADIEQLSGAHFNSVLANLYRDGQDSMGWHADDESELGPNPVIASLTFGHARTFKLRHKQSGEQAKLVLQHGSLLLMSGTLQHEWQHSVAKTQKTCGERINLTFRNVNNKHAK